MMLKAFSHRLSNDWKYVVERYDANEEIRSKWMMQRALILDSIPI